MTTIRPIDANDVGKIAYMIMRWNSELPEWLRRVEGGARHAQAIAEAIVANERFIGRALELDGQVIGGLCIFLGDNLFSLRQYGQLMMWYVEPEHRGGLHGIRLLREAIKIAEERKLGWLETYPWADDEGASRLLPRLGFFDSCSVFVKRIH